MLKGSDFTQFECCECRRQVVRFPALGPNDVQLCAECLWVPGWYVDPGLADALDPEYGNDR